MKTFFKSAVLAFLLVLSSCGTDDASLSNEEINEQAEQLESTPLEANQVSNNVNIKGGTKEEGMPPTPNEAISLEVSNAGTTAFLGEGFEVSLNSDADILGVYIQFKAKDGSVADSYYDVNIDVNSSNKQGKPVRALKTKQHTLNSLSNKADDVILDVDFGSQILPGEFCYVLCVYDIQGNISAPQEVCATVESWGGYSEMAGTWRLVKEEETYDGETSISYVGIENCETETYECSNGIAYEASECYTPEYGTVIVNSDGTYTADFKGVDRVLAYEASAQNCEAVYEDQVYRHQSEGNWAYVAEEGRLTIVEYMYSNEENGEVESVTLEPGDAELIIDGNIVISGDSFFITESEDYNGDGIIDEVNKYYFEK